MDNSSFVTMDRQQADLYRWRKGRINLLDISTESSYYRGHKGMHLISVTFNGDVVSNKLSRLASIYPFVAHNFNF